jgi:REP-associated tyrosine transposase
MPRDWVAHVNRPQTEAEVEALRRSVTRGAPYGSEEWQEKTAKRLGPVYTLRLRGRPKKDATT